MEDSSSKAKRKIIHPCVDTVDKNAKPILVCLECQRERRCLYPSSNGRGHGRLCWTCYSDRTIRAKHIDPKGRNRGKGNQGRHLDINRRPDPATEPTQFMPGSDGKIEVMTARFSAGQEVFHPADAKNNDRDEVGRKLHGLPTLLPDGDGDAGDEIDSLAQLPRVDSGDDLWTVPELVCDLIRGEASFDTVAGVGVPQTVGAHAIAGAIVEASALRRSPDIVAEGVLCPRQAIAVREDVISGLGGSYRLQEMHGLRVQTDNPRPARGSKGLVLEQDQVRGVAGIVETDVVPGKKAHLAGPAAGQEQKRQGSLQGGTGNLHKSVELLQRGRAPRLRNQPSQAPRAGIRADRDQLLVAGPAKAGQDRGNAGPLGIHGFPAGMGAKELREVMLAQVFDGALAELFDEASQVAPVVIRALLRDCAGRGTVGDVFEVKADDFAGHD